MAQSLAKVLVHLIFCTKNRDPIIPAETRPQLHAYLVGILVNLGCPALQVGGTADHVHALFSLGRTTTVADVVEEARKSSSKWMKRQGVQAFAWQAGYGAFSIGQSQAPALVRYIQQQEQHHRRLTFQDELRRFLDRYGASYDERYVWD
ncbi:transposase [Candidatus Binatia bacterium]|nr:transposase [Candidatus Binatia bacterium]